MNFKSPRGPYLMIGNDSIRTMSNYGRFTFPSKKLGRVFGQVEPLGVTPLIPLVQSRFHQPRTACFLPCKNGQATKATNQLAISRMYAREPIFLRKHELTNLLSTSTFEINIRLIYIGLINIYLQIYDFRYMHTIIIS